MPFTSVPDKATGDQFTEAMWDTFIRDNLNYLIGLLDGTGADIVAVPNALRVANDVNFQLAKNGVNPLLTVDSGDTLQYIRASDTLAFAVATAIKWQLDGNGKMGGSSIFTSLETSLASGVGTGISHGLVNQPRWVGGLYGTTAGTRINALDVSPVARSTARLTGWTATGISVENNTAATIYCQVWAIL